MALFQYWQVFCITKLSNESLPHIFWNFPLKYLLKEYSLKDQHLRRVSFYLIINKFTGLGLQSRFCRFIAIIIDIIKFSGKNPSHIQPIIRFPFKVDYRKTGMVCFIERIVLACDSWWCTPAKLNPSKHETFLTNSVLMLAQRRRRWANIKSALFQCIIVCVHLICWFNAGPASQAMGHHYINIRSLSCACWVGSREVRDDFPKYFNNLRIVI